MGSEVPDHSTPRWERLSPLAYSCGLCERERPARCSRCPGPSFSIPADPGNLNLSCRCAEEGVNEKYQSRTVAVLGLELIREWSNTTWSDNCLRRTGIGEHSRENHNPKEGNGVGPRRGFNWSRRGTSVTTPSSRRRAASEAGFSILEVAFAIAILVIILVPVASVLGTIFKVGANSRFEQQATEIATSTLDNEVALGAATLLAETGTKSLPSVTSSNQTYLLEMEVAPYDPGSSRSVFLRRATRAPC